MCYLRGELDTPVNVILGRKILYKASCTSDPDCPQPSYMFGLLQLGELSDLARPDPTLSSGAGISAIQRAAWLGFAPALLRMGLAWQGGEKGYDSVIALRYFHVVSRQQRYRRTVLQDTTAGLDGVAEAEISKWMLCGSEDAGFGANEAAAFEFAQMAAELSNPIAEFAVGYFHEVGIHVAQNTETAIHWYQIAAGHGNADAKERLDELTANANNTISQAQHKRALTIKGRGSIKHYKKDSSDESDEAEKAEKAEDADAETDDLAGDVVPASDGVEVAGADDAAELGGSAKPCSKNRVASGSARLDGAAEHHADGTEPGTQAGTPSNDEPEKSENSENFTNPFKPNFGTKPSPSPVLSPSSSSSLSVSSLPSAVRPPFRQKNTSPPTVRRPQHLRKMSEPTTLYPPPPAPMPMHSRSTRMSLPSPQFPAQERNTQRRTSSPVHAAENPYRPPSSVLPNGPPAAGSPRAFSAGLPEDPRQYNYPVRPGSVPNLAPGSRAVSQSRSRSPSHFHSQPPQQQQQPQPPQQPQYQQEYMQQKAQPPYPVSPRSHKHSSSRSSLSNSSEYVETATMPVPPAAVSDLSDQDKKKKKKKRFSLANVFGSREASSAPTSPPSGPTNAVPLLDSPQSLNRELSPTSSHHSSATVIEHPTAGQTEEYPRIQSLVLDEDMPRQPRWGDKPRNASVPAALSSPHLVPPQRVHSQHTLDLPPTFQLHNSPGASPRISPANSRPASPGFQGRAESPSRTSTLMSSTSNTASNWSTQESMDSSISSLRSQTNSPSQPRPKSAVMVFPVVHSDKGAKTFEEMGIPKTAGKQKEDCVIM